jgi:two-component system, chemotaxis family, protein-glutamate methylesterase/glutaminase
LTKARWARVLIVEDSPNTARVLVDGISRDQRLAVAGVALTAGEAVRLAEQLRPDVMTVDLTMPDETGLDVILRVLRTSYVPIIVVSSESNSGSASPAFRALLAGAADMVPKPAGDPASLRVFFDDLNDRIASLAKAQAVPTYRAVPARPNKSRSQSNGASLECIVVGASTGGPAALVEFLNGLGSDFPVPVVIVQHIATSHRHRPIFSLRATAGCR